MKVCMFKRFFNKERDIKAQRIKEQSYMENLLKKVTKCTGCNVRILVIQRIDNPEERSKKELWFKFGKDMCEECEIRRYYEKRNCL